VNQDVDGRNLRTFHMVQRFGRDLLWPTQRYVDGFTKAKVPGPDGTSVANPIFAGGKRALDMVVFAGIVGVPRPLVENADGSPRVLSNADWETIASVDPSRRDPHMIESIAPRPGLPKFVGDRTIDPVHGGERDVASGEDLQYACIGARAKVEPPSWGPVATECGTATGASNPICEASTQTYFKAYPGLRILRTIRALGARGHVASICADSYAPIVAGLADKIHDSCAGL
jgi:hypothetical protein